MIYQNDIDRCKYRMGDLKNIIYLLPYSHSAMTITLDESFANSFASSIDNDSLYSLRVDSASYTSDSTFDNNRFGFENTLSITINETNYKTYYDIIQRLISEKWIVLFVDNNNNKFVFNYEFPSHLSYTYSFNDSSVGNTCSIEFKSFSNVPNLAYLGTLNPKYKLREEGCLGYNIGKIEKLEMADKAYTKNHISEDGYSVETDSNHPLVNVDFLKGSFEYSEEYKDDLYTQTLSFAVPFENYKHYFHYNLLEFKDNVYYAYITTTNNNNILVGQREGLFPSYSISTSEEKSGSNNIVITLTASYTAFPSAVNDDDTEVDVLTAATYEAADKQCIAHRLTTTLIKKTTSNGTVSYYCLAGTESYYPQYTIVGTYTRYSTQFGIPIVTRAICNPKPTEPTDCSTKGLPSIINLSTTISSMTYAVESKCDISFSAESCSTVSFVNGVLTVSRAVEEGTCNLHVQYGDDFEGDIPIIITQEKNLEQKFHINKDAQDVDVVLHKLLFDVDTISNPNNLMLIINGNDNGWKIKVPKNDTADSKTYVVKVTYNNGITETIYIYQSPTDKSERKEKESKEQSAITETLSYRWLETEEQVCLPQGTTQINCSSSTTASTDEFLCVGGNKYSLVKNYISTYCDGTYDFIGYSLNEIIEEQSSDCYSEAKKRGDESIIDDDDLIGFDDFHYNDE